MAADDSRHDPAPAGFGYNPRLAFHRLARMRLALRPALAVFALLAVLMASTRMHHFGALPDASWAVFFAAGVYLRAQVRWAFPALMALAVAVDWAVISASGLSFWSHYCVSPGYWFLLPAHAALWAAGQWASARGLAPSWGLLGRVALALGVGVVLCHAFAQGGFYWLSASVAEPTVAGWVKNYFDWLLPYARVAAMYVGVIAAAQLLAGRWLAPLPITQATR
jgi:hypothetical protein